MVMGSARISKENKALQNKICLFINFQSTDGAADIFLLNHSYPLTTFLSIILKERYKLNIVSVAALLKSMC